MTVTAVRYTGPDLDRTVVLSSKQIVAFPLLPPLAPPVVTVSALRPVPDLPDGDEPDENTDPEPDVDDEPLAARHPARRADGGGILFGVVLTVGLAAAVGPVFLHLPHADAGPSTRPAEAVAPATRQMSLCDVDPESCGIALVVPAVLTQRPSLAEAVALEANR